MKTIHGLYAIVDTTFSPKYSHFQLANLLLLGGCKILQLRMKSADSAVVLSTAKQLMKLKKQYDFTFIINDHPHIAGELKADGVHVGNNDMPIADIRKILGEKYLIGYSSHSVDEAIEAEKTGADYIAFGAIFPTKTKGPDHPVQGIDKLTRLCSLVKRPIVAIGGINRSNFDDVVRAGATSVAMITGLTQAKDVVTETRWYTGRY